MIGILIFFIAAIFAFIFVYCFLLEENKSCMTINQLKLIDIKKKISEHKDRYKW